MTTEIRPPSPEDLESPSSPAPPGRGIHSPGRAAIAARHLRTDRWWVPQLATGLGLLAFIVYSTWRAFWGLHTSYAAPYVSPL